MRRLWTILVIMLLLFAGQSVADNRSLGPMTISGNQTIFLHLIGNGAAAANPFPVTVQFLDSTGALVATASGECSSDICPPPGSVPVDSTHVTTLSLSGAALGLAGDQAMVIQPFITAPGPGLTHLLTTVDIFNASSAARVALRFDPTVLARMISLPPLLTLGPVTLGRGELARFSIGYYRAGSVAFTMFFQNASGTKIGTSKAVNLHYLESATIELDGDAVDIAGVPGVIRAGTNETTDVSVGATLEIIDKATGAVKVLLSNGGGDLTSSGGGGAGSQ